ncbi:MAG: hypothetical protein DRG78_04675 [Epsilonproteobacteria bacterium]|nr:MAG: hypothetical protein DRG78_04675 [Campylobacterota bacterium]
MRFYIHSFKIDISNKLIDNNTLPVELINAIKVIRKHSTKVPSTQKQKDAAKDATQSRQQIAQNKIENAVNILRMEDELINNSSVQSVSGCSINTVKKYGEFIEAQEKLRLECCK